jgi:hypothetical protein
MALNFTISPWQKQTHPTSRGTWEFPKKPMAFWGIFWGSCTMIILDQYCDADMILFLSYFYPDKNWGSGLVSQTAKKFINMSGC